MYASIFGRNMHLCRSTSTKGPFKNALFKGCLGASGSLTARPRPRPMPYPRPRRMPWIGRSGILGFLPMANSWIRLGFSVGPVVDFGVSLWAQPLIFGFLSRPSLGFLVFSLGPIVNFWDSLWAQSWILEFLSGPSLGFLFFLSGPNRGFLGFALALKALMRPL